MYKISLMFFLFCFSAISLNAETIELPKPTGKYKVGTTVFHWKDETREELWTKNPNDYRELMVQIWYPADKNNKGKNAPYIFGLEKLRPSIEKYWENMPDVRHHATLDVPISTSQSKYPVLIFSHGMNSSRFLYTSISQELASQGYIVASIDHTYWGPGVAFPDGKVVNFEDGMIARNKLEFNDIDRMMLEGVTVMSADQAFVAEQLTKINADSKLFKDKLDLTKMGTIGHSMGGMAATASCLKYKVFKTCVSLDGVNSFLNRMPNPSSKPFLLLLNSQWGKDTPPKIKKSYLEAWENPTVAIINGTKHNSYSDIPLIEPPEKMDGLIEPLRAFRIISSYSVAFLNKKLKQIQKNEMPVFDEMEFKDLKAIGLVDVPDSIVMKYELYKLENGLQVLLQPDSDVENISVEFWLKTGIRDEEPDKYGFAHFFEHITPYGLRGKTKELELLKSYRTGSNAQVRKDFTRYFTEVKPEGLELALQYTADRLNGKSTDITPEKVEDQRVRVLAEIKRNLSHPFGNVEASKVFYSATFGNTHPYGHGGYGTIENNENFKSEDFQKWYEKYVHPENAILFVVGNFDKKTAKKYIEKHFGKIPGKKADSEKLKISTAIQTSKDHTIEAEFTENYLSLSWAIPGWGSQEDSSFRILANILDERLKAKQPKEASGTGSKDLLDFYQYAGQFGVYASFSDFKNKENIENFLEQEIKNLIESGITDSELEKAKQKEIQTVQEMKKGLGFQSSRTELLGESLLFKNNPNFYFFRLEKQNSLKKEEVEKVAKIWFSIKPSKIFYKSEIEEKTQEKSVKISKKESQSSRRLRIKAEPAKGFFPPYYLLIQPNLLDSKKQSKIHSLLVILNNTGTNNDFTFYESKFNSRISRFGKFF